MAPSFSEEWDSSPATPSTILPLSPIWVRTASPLIHMFPDLLNPLLFQPPSPSALLGSFLVGCYNSSLRYDMCCPPSLKTNDEPASRRSIPFLRGKRVTDFCSR